MKRWLLILSLLSGCAGKVRQQHSSLVWFQQTKSAGTSASPIKWDTTNYFSTKDSTILIYHNGKFKKVTPPYCWFETTKCCDIIHFVDTLK